MDHAFCFLCRGRGCPVSRGVVCVYRASSPPFKPVIASGWPRIRSRRGPTRTHLCRHRCSESDNYLAQGLELLELEIEKQVLPDGGHVSRNPETQLGMLKALLEIREALTAAHIDLPDWLKIVIERMVPMTRALRLGDGALVCFHGGRGERERRLI